MASLLASPGAPRVHCGGNGSLLIHAPLPPSWPAEHSHVWLDGGHRLAPFCVHPASRLQPAPAERGRLLDDWRRRNCRNRRRAALSCAREPGRVLRGPVALAHQPVRVCMVRWIPRRPDRAPDSRAPGEVAHPRIPGRLLARCGGRLRDRANRLPAFRRRRLRRANVATLGHELPEWRCADDGARASHAGLRIPHLDGDRRVSLAHGNKSAARAESGRRDFLQLPDPHRSRAVFDRVHPHQSEIVFRPLQRAGGQPPLHSFRGPASLAPQKKGSAYSLTMAPSFITKETFLSVWIFSSGFSGVAMMSAAIPGFKKPRSLSTPSSRAAFAVMARRISGAGTAASTQLSMYSMASVPRVSPGRAMSKSVSKAMLTPIL